MSGTPTIVKASELNAESISYAPPKVNTVGGKNVRFQLGGNRGMTYVNIPVMLTWGVNEYVDEATGRRSYDMSSVLHWRHSKHWRIRLKLMLLPTGRNGLIRPK